MFAIKFMKVATGISMILVAASLFLFSLSRATAQEPDSFPNPIFAGPTSADNGRVMFSFYRNPIYDPNTGEFAYWEMDALAWDTRTGESVIYWFGKKDGKFNWNLADRFSFPANPLQPEE